MTDEPVEPVKSEGVTLPIDEKGFAALVHASGILLGFIVPLVVWLTKKDQSPYLARQSLEALNFQITMLIAFAVCGALTLVLIGLLLLPVVYLFSLAMSIVAAVKTSNGIDFRYPFTLRLIK